MAADLWKEAPLSSPSPLVPLLPVSAVQTEISGYAVLLYTHTGCKMRVPSQQSIIKRVV